MRHRAAGSAWNATARACRPTPGSSRPASRPSSSASTPWRRGSATPSRSRVCFSRGWPLMSSRGRRIDSPRRQGRGAFSPRQLVRPRPHRGHHAEGSRRRQSGRARHAATRGGSGATRAGSTTARGRSGAQGDGAAAMSRRRPAAACLAPALALALLATAPRASAQTPTIGDLTSRKVEVHRDTLASANASRAMENYRHFLELQNTDPKLRAEALRRLGDLNLDAGEMQRLEQEVTAVDLQGAEAIKLYTTLLKAYPDYARNDQVLYQLARAYETTGQSGQALGTLDRIVQRYPQSPQLDEVQFRRGELLFSDKRYADAERAYAAVIGRGAGSVFFQQSLYKRGWSLFKQSLAPESLPSFGGVLDQELGNGAGGKSVRLEKLKRADRELVEDTLRVMSITFSYNDDGAASLEQ